MPSEAANQDDDELERTRTLVAAPEPEPVPDTTIGDDVDEDTAVLEQLANEVTEDVLEIEVELDLSDVPAAAPSQGPIAPEQNDASLTDPPADPASQALELAALRAEVARLNREQLELHRMLRLRDRWVQTLQEELSAAQTEFRETTCLLSEAQVQLVLLKENKALAERQAESEAIVFEEVELFPLSTAAPARDAPVTEELARTQRIPPATTSADALLASQSTDTEPLPEGRCLVPLEPKGAVIVLKLETTTLGRARRNNICISSSAVSRDHARIVMTAGNVTVFDMDSANGCYVNDDRVKQQKLFDGDVLRLGDCSYLFADDVG